MQKLKIYLDTSVISAYFDERVPIRLEETRRFWKNSSAHEFLISDIVIKEVMNTKKENIRQQMLDLVSNLQVTQITTETESLASEYVTRQIIPSTYFDDALHIAIAVINNADILVSWNFEHIVKRKTRIEVNLVNTLLGYKNIDIIAPPEF